MSVPVETVAANLRRLRAGRGLSLSELASRTGVAKATLSQLEQGRGNPTLGTLWALATALGVPLGDLIAEPPAPTVEVVRNADAARVTGTAVDAGFLHRFTAGPAVLEVYELRVATTTQHSDAHAAGVGEHIVVHSGRMLAGPADAPVELGPGDYLSFTADVPHTYGALGGPARATLLMRYPRDPVPGR